MPNMQPNKTPMPEQDPHVRNKNFKEVAVHTKGKICFYRHVFGNTSLGSSKADNPQNAFFRSILRPDNGVFHLLGGNILRVYAIQT